MMPLDFKIEFFPEVTIDDGLLLRRHPVTLFPVGDPRGDPVLQVLGVRDDFDIAFLAQRAEPFNCGPKLHAVIRGVRLTAEDFLAMWSIAKDRGPASRSRIAEAC